MQNRTNGLRVRGISKHFVHPGGIHSEVLKDVSFDVIAGEVCCILGPSGCGKTTLLNILAGIETASGGQLWDGENLVADLLPDLGVVFQENALLPWKSVIQNLEFYLSCKGFEKNKARRTAFAYLAEIELLDYKDYLPSRLSVGMRQRVALGCSLCYNPRVLLMDEPFGALDAITKHKMHEYFQRLHNRSRFTAIMITHDIHEAIRLADLIVVLSPKPTRILDTIRVTSEKDHGDRRFGRLDTYEEIYNQLQFAW